MSFLRHINSVSPYGSSYKHFCLQTSFKSPEDALIDPLGIPELYMFLQKMPLFIS